jgi:hypothetical protein
MAGCLSLQDISGGANITGVVGTANQVTATLTGSIVQIGLVAVPETSSAIYLGVAAHSAIYLNVNQQVVGTGAMTAGSFLAGQGAGNDPAVSTFAGANGITTVYTGTTWTVAIAQTATVILSNLTANSITDLSLAANSPVYTGTNGLLSALSTSTHQWMMNIGGTQTAVSLNSPQSTLSIAYSGANVNVDVNQAATLIITNLTASSITDLSLAANSPVYTGTNGLLSALATTTHQWMMNIGGTQTAVGLNSPLGTMVFTYGAGNVNVDVSESATLIVSNVTANSVTDLGLAANTVLYAGTNGLLKGLPVPAGLFVTTNGGAPLVAPMVGTGGIAVTWNGTAWVLTNSDSATTSQCIGGSTYSTGSASQAATGIVTGTGGASFTAGMQYGVVYWPGSGTASYILAVLTSTTLLVENTAVVSSATYIICYQGVQSAGGSETITNLLVGQGPAILGGAGVVYSMGTASQSTTAVTGTGTRWDYYGTSLVGMTIQWSNGATATITGYTSSTSLTVTPSQTVAAGSYVIICTPYSAGSAAQNGYAIWGNGTAFTVQMVGTIITWASGARAYISGYVSATQLTADVPQIVANSSFSISTCGDNAYMGAHSISTSLQMGVTAASGFSGYLNSWTLSGPPSGDGVTNNPPLITLYSYVNNEGSVYSCPVGQMGAYDFDNQMMTLLGGMYMDNNNGFYLSSSFSGNGITMGNGQMNFYYAASSGMDTCGTKLTPTTPLQISGNNVNLPQLSPTTGILAISSGTISSNSVSGATNQISVSGTTISLTTNVTLAGSMTFGNIPCTGSTNQLCVYAKATVSATFTGACTTGSVTIVAIRVGDQISVRIPYASCTGSSGNILQSSANLASLYFPAVNGCWSTTVESGGATTAGSVQINTAGTIFFYAGIGCAGNFAASGTNALANTASSTYSTYISYTAA